jgi:hypothetical protein
LNDKPHVRRIGSLVSQLMSRRGYAQVVANQEFHQVIVGVVGPALQSSFQVGKLRAGVLQLYASDSVTLQELNFHKRNILRRLQADLPANKVTDLRLRIQV